MNITKELILQPDKPARLMLWHEGSVNQLVIGLTRGQVLAKHKTPYPALLVVLKGSIEFRLPQERTVLTALDTFSIPVNELHEVEGLDEENLLLVTKHVTPVL